MRDMNNINFSDLQQLISSAGPILLTTHINPDCDGLGSEIALFYHLKSIGKECRIINNSGMRDLYNFLDMDGHIEKYSTDMDDWIKSVDITILLDIGDANRIGNMKEIVFENTKTICIDHHRVRKDNTYSYTMVNLNEPSTGSIIWKYLRSLDSESKLTMPIATGLYAALVTDTGSFKYYNTNEEAHLMATDLINSGIIPYDIHRHIYENRSLEQVRLLGRVIENINFHNNGEFVLFIITLYDLEQCRATHEDIEGFTDFCRSIRGVEIACMILEESENNLRINFRSKGKYIINDVAEKLNGGGHPLAAGANILNQSVAEAEKIILTLISNKIHGDDDVS
jgi:bifunctional oligoribonuclease and PAP phosphatase NrnA